MVGRRAGRSPFTLLLYHHYDVPPNRPVARLAPRSIPAGRARWPAHGPWCGRRQMVRLAAHLNAIASLLETEGELPCGVVVVVEGEALSGSPNLGAAVAELYALLKADACLASAGERAADDRPYCYTGAKGLLQVRLRQRRQPGPPPGLAASVASPVWRLLWALAKMKSDQEEVLIEGFYEDVEGPSRSENQSMRSLQMDEAGRKQAWNISQFLFDLGGAALCAPRRPYQPAM